MYILIKFCIKIVSLTRSLYIEQDDIIMLMDGRFRAFSL